VSSVLQVTQGVRGLILTHTYGLPEDTEKLGPLAESHGLTVINDYCQAPGAIVNGSLASTIGDVGVCSFGATKPMTTGEGGVVTTDNPDIATAIRKARSNSGVDLAKPPTNVQMSDIEAAVGLTQINRYPDLLASRRTVAETYRAELPTIVTMQSIPDGFTHVYHRFLIRAPDRESLVNSPSMSGVETNVGIRKPLTNFRCVDTPQPGPYPEVTRLLDESLLLPMYPGLKQSDAECIAACVSDHYN
jgi:dTDP-4-amino-4,6-dideoxygalactose transaminase